MTRTALWTIGLALTCAIVAVLWQNAHYLYARRTFVQDRQAMFYSGDVFHVVTFLKTRPGVDPIAALRAFRHETAGAGQWIYAGLAVVNVPSARIGPVEWSAVTLVQYPSRAAYESEAASPGYKHALAAFERSYAEGARRSAAENLLLPQILLVRRILRVLSFARSSYPFTPADATDIPERGRRMMAALRAQAAGLGSHAAVVVNLQKRGTPAQEAADARYVRAMTDLMAERGYGPMHLAKAEALPGDCEFDRVAIVYYPGTGFFADMFGSTFYQGIYRDKQLDDNQSTITVPVLDLL
ncbi:MAG TPA: hypothetical protein VMU08_07730 [Rhizomicrobium sp.]|nr:hypothetical protein [Rhizomicrobium sp.]